MQDKPKIYRVILPSIHVISYWPLVELLHLLGRTQAKDVMVELSSMAWSLPSCGPVDMIHVEHSAVAVNTSFPVWGNR